METINLAASIDTGPFQKVVNSLINSAFGKVIVGALLIAGGGLLLAVALAWILKAAGRGQSAFVQRFASSAKTTIVYILVAVLMLAPAVFVIAIVTLMGHASEWFGNEFLDIING